MKIPGPILFILLLVGCVVFVWPLYEEEIERDLTRKVAKLYTNQIKSPEIRFDGLKLTISEEDLTPHFHRKLDQIAGAYIPPLPPEKAKAPPVKYQAPSDTPPQEAEPERQATYFSLSRVPSAVEMRGVLPSAGLHQSLLSTVSESLPEVILNDHTGLADLPDETWWTRHVRGFLPELLRATDPAYTYVSYRPDQFSVNGRCSDQEDLKLLQRLADKVPEGITTNVKLTFFVAPKNNGVASNSLTVAAGEVKPARAQVISENPEAPLPTLTTLPITFGGSGSAWLHPKFRKRIEKIVLLIREDPEDMRYIVGSHGTKDRKLSEARAQAVVDQLVENGVAAERLIIRHFPKKRGELRRVEVTPHLGEDLPGEPSQIEQEKKDVPEPEPEPEPLPRDLEKPLAGVTEVQIAFGGGGSAWLHPKYEPRLKAVAEQLLAHEGQDQRFTVGSYGTKNRALSELRAKAVYDQLVKYGVSEERLVMNHFTRLRGEARRVQITLAPPKKEEPESEPVPENEPAEATPESDPGEAPALVTPAADSDPSAEDNPE